VLRLKISVVSLIRNVSTSHVKVNNTEIYATISNVELYSAMYRLFATGNFIPVCFGKFYEPYRVTIDFLDRIRALRVSRFSPKSK